MTTPVASETEVRRPMRADARRNYERLLLAAKDAFAERGTEASLEDIARRAGVGIGTLYRHFPSRDELADAVFSEDYERLAAQADSLAESEDHAEALITWMRTLMSYNAAIPGLLKSVIHAIKNDQTTRLHKALDHMRTSGRRLLDLAVATGEFREGLDYSEIVLLVCTVARSAQEAEWDPERVERMFSLVLDGMRHRAAAYR